MSEQTKEQLIFNMALALRRLLILTDKRRDAARFAQQVLVEADKVLDR